MKPNKCTCLFPHPHWPKGHFRHKESETFRLYGKVVAECSIGCPIHDKKLNKKK